MSAHQKSFLLALVIGALLRLINLGSRVLWCDEFLAITMGRQSLGDMLYLVTHYDAHPPLFYGLMHFILKAGESEFLLRIVPAAFGILCVPMAWKLGRQIAGEKAGFYLAFIMAFSPAHILWSQVIKSYSIFTFLLLLSFSAFLEIIEGGKKRRSWIILFVANILMLHIHNLAVLILIIQAAVLLCGNMNKRWMLYHAFLLILYIPWMTRLIVQLRLVGSVRTLPLFFKFLYQQFYIFFGETVHPLFLVFLVPAGIALAVLFFRGIKHLTGMEKNKRVLVVSGLFVPLLFVPFTTSPQNIMPFSVFWFIIIVFGLLKTRSPAGIWIVLCCFIPSLVFFYMAEGAAEHFHDKSKLLPYRQVSTMISREGRKSEAVLFTEPRELAHIESIDHFGPWDWYYRGNLAMFELHPDRTPNLEEKLESIMEKHDGAWLLLNYGFVGAAWNDGIKDFFYESDSVKIREMKFLENYSFLDVLRGREKEKYYFLEVYHFVKVRENE